MDCCNANCHHFCIILLDTVTIGKYVISIFASCLKENEIYAVTPRHVGIQGPFSETGRRYLRVIICVFYVITMSLKRGTVILTIRGSIAF